MVVLDSVWYGNRSVLYQAQYDQRDRCERAIRHDVVSLVLGLSSTPLKGKRREVLFILIPVHAVGDFSSFSRKS